MIIYISIIVATVFCYLFCRKRSNINLENQHCLVTGGSSGIGLAFAIRVAKAGANVTIIARSQERLEDAKEKILSAVKNPNQKISTFSMDISNPSANLKEIVEKAESCCGPISFLVNCAGTSVCRDFEKLSNEDFMNMININYLGSVQMAQAVLPSMKSNNNGRIIFVSSLAGVFSFYGYSAYSASKFAVIGAAQALHMEVRPYNISVTVSLPPDTNTPGYAEEIKDKPIETIRISEGAGLFSAEEVAEKMLIDALKGKFLSSVGFEGWLLCTLSSGTTPISSLFETVTQVLTMGVLRLVFFIYLKQCYSTVSKCAAEKKLTAESTNG